MPHAVQLCADCLGDEYDQFRHTCVHESQAKNAAWFATYAVNDYAHWDYEMDDATLTFSSAGSQTELVCRMQVVGSHHGASWEWSWGNPNLPLSCRADLEIVRGFGEAKHWDRLSTLFLEYDEFVGWECVSVANHLLGGIGAYRCGTKDDAVWLVVISCELTR